MFVDFEATGTKGAGEFSGTIGDLHDHATTTRPQLRDRPGGPHGTVGNDHNVVGDSFDLLEQVRRQEHIDLELGADSPDECEHVIALHWIEAVGWFVQQDDRRPMCNRLRELHSLALPRGHRAHGPRAFLAQPDEPQRITRSSGRLSTREPVNLRDVANQILRSDVVGQIVMFGAVPDVLSKFWAGVRWILTKNSEVAAVGMMKTEEHAQKRGLPRSVRTEQSSDSTWHLHREVGEHGMAAPRFRHRSCRDDTGRGGHGINDGNVHRSTVPPHRGASYQG